MEESLVNGLSGFVLAPTENVSYQLAWANVPANVCPKHSKQTKSKITLPYEPERQEETNTYTHEQRSKPC